LRDVVENILGTMIKKDYEVVSILAVSTGIFNFPLDECVKIYAKAIRKFIDENEGKMKGREIVLCK
jgi:O-acetyl-ADP-ribose deacetylase (regulator of RNase III)